MKFIPASRYTPMAVSLHWLMAILIFAGFTLGQYMGGLPLSPQKLQIVSWHKWLGVSIFLLLLVRVAWRMTHTPPTLPASMNAMAVRLAHAGHLLLYALMLAVPLSGWLMSSAKGFQTVYFGLLPIPDLLSKDKALGDLLKEVHQALNWLFAVAVLGHVAVALKHHFLDKDGLLVRMSFGRANK